jgi:hypothetical protein
MTERMEEKGLVQVRVWVEKRDEEFVKFIAKFCREERKKNQKYDLGAVLVTTIFGLLGNLRQNITFQNQITYMTIILACVLG